MAKDIHKIYLVSGIGPGKGGVGRLMYNLKAKASDHGISTLFRDDFQPLREQLAQRRYFAVIYGFIRRYWLHFKFWVSIKLIKNASIIFLHPQTAGMENFFSLVKRNKVFLYVMDNSFFCMQSYNVHPKTHRECLQCLYGSSNADFGCSSISMNMSRNQAIASLDKLRSFAHNLVFLAQNQRQADLLCAAFGNIQVQVVGLDTGEFNLNGMNNKEEQVKRNSNLIVFHGATVIAKGIDYFICLAEHLPEYRFVIPDSRFNVEQYLGKSIIAKNVEFIPCSWESGLADLVAEAIIVINPSLWSAPIEGALVKSFIFNSNVATVETLYGYEGEVCTHTNHLRLSIKPDLAAKQLRAKVDLIKSNDVKYYMENNEMMFFPVGAVDLFDFVKNN